VGVFSEHSVEKYPCTVLSCKLSVWFRRL